MKFDAEEFYPTPKTLFDKITDGVDWSKIEYVLEPSAGKGDIAEYINEANKNYMQKVFGIYSSKADKQIDIDCIEIDKDLRGVLKEKGFRVVHDDFLTYYTWKKYDLIIMNPPFSKGATHLTHALNMLRDGAGLICILNAETLRNPCTNERTALLTKLIKMDADLAYYEDEFVKSERPTKVEVAVVKVFKPAIKEKESEIFKKLKPKYFPEKKFENVNTEVTVSDSMDYIDVAIAKYNMEIEAGLMLIDEYKALSPLINHDLSNKDSSPMISLSVMDSQYSYLPIRENYIRCVRRKYWEGLFNNKEFTAKLTSNLQTMYYDKVNQLMDYDFSRFNIDVVRNDIQQNLIKGVEDCIISLFDNLTSYSYGDKGVIEENIHYYNGWKTNSAFMINKKVILPGYVQAWDRWMGRYQPARYDGPLGKLRDIEKALNYLDNGNTSSASIDAWLSEAQKTGQSRNINTKFMTLTFYKKGTCHIVFKDDELLKKLNIFGSQQKGWLPCDYGNKAYKDFTQEEKAVIDSFQGKDDYEKVRANKDYFIYNPKDALPSIEMREGVA